MISVDRRANTIHFPRILRCLNVSRKAERAKRILRFAR
jgi:hypothetical protein